MKKKIMKAFQMNTPFLYENTSISLWQVNLLNFSNILSVIVPILLSVAFMTIIERKILATMQRRLGPTDVGYFGVLQPFSDALKLILKESVVPAQSNKILFYLAPVVTLVFSLLGWVIIPFGQGLVISDWSMGILYTLALSSLAVYGVLFAGWSANSKYAFLGSKRPNKDVNLYNLLFTKYIVQGASAIRLFFFFFKLIKKKYKLREEWYNNNGFQAKAGNNKNKQTVSEKFFLFQYWNPKTFLDTLCITPYNKGSKVKFLLKEKNSQVTKAFNSWVGTSEAIRLLSIIKNKSYNKKNFSSIAYHRLEKKSRNWNQWLAGLIDGDGNFNLTKKGYASLEITMDLRDEHPLQIIKNVYGGTIILVSGKRVLRYRLRHKAGFLALVHDINGEIRNSKRLMQLNKICIKYEISLIYPQSLTYSNGWLSGFFDADGTISLNSANGQLAISLTQKTRELLEPLIELYGGNIYIDRTSNNFKWYITNKENILNLIEYFKQFPPKTLKKNRLHLVPRCYELKDIGAHKITIEKKPLILKSWIKFKEKWDKYEQ
jgi:NADH dehydrogenase/LAGLIDADG endonuclease